MQSKAATVQQYLSELPDDRRAEVEAVRALVNRHVDGDVEEGMQYGMICWYIPHRVFPAGYHVDPRIPLGYAALASQKRHLSLYMNVYGDGEEERWFRSAWQRSGKKLDMGKSCIRFQRADDLATDVIAEAIRRVDSKRWIQIYTSALEKARAAKGSRPAATKAAAKKAPAKKAPAKKATAKKATAKKATARKPAPRTRAAAKKR